MGDKSFFDNIKRETNSVLSKVFDKVEVVSKTSVLKLRISDLKGKIRDHKVEIGEFVISNKKKFTEFPEIVETLEKIKLLEKQIKINNTQIEKLKKKVKSEEVVKENESTSS